MVSTFASVSVPKQHQNCKTNKVNSLQVLKPFLHMQTVYKDIILTSQAQKPLFFLIEAKEGGS